MVRSLFWRLIHTWLARVSRPQKGRRKTRTAPDWSARVRPRLEQLEIRLLPTLNIVAPGNFGTVDPQFATKDEIKLGTADTAIANDTTNATQIEATINKAISRFWAGEACKATLQQISPCPPSTCGKTCYKCATA
jgi:hypothetical protein